MESEKRNIVVVGASRGIGAAVAQHFTQKGDSVFSISRGQPIAGRWIQADISLSPIHIRRCRRIEQVSLPCTHVFSK